MFSYRRAVRFEDVDAAQIVFFSRFLNYCHEAMEAMLAPTQSGYAGMIVDRKLGLPAVRVEADFRAPLRFGDDVRIDVTAERIGRSSCVLRYDFFRVGSLQSQTLADSVATVRHTVVLSDLTILKSVPFPDDVRRAIEAHLEV